jgi:hypothetical protein
VFEVSENNMAYWRDRLDLLEAERDRYAEALREIVGLGTRHPHGNLRFAGEHVHVARNALKEDA